MLLTTFRRFAVGLVVLAVAFGGAITASVLGATPASAAPPVETELTLTTSGSPAAVGTPITFTATVRQTGPTGHPTSGTVSFYDRFTFLGSASLNTSHQASITTSTLALGDHVIIALFEGNAVYDFSWNYLWQYVTPATTTTVASNLNPSQYSQPVTFTAHVASAAGTPGGTVAFKRDGVNITGCTARPLVAGNATCTTNSLAIGTHAITAAYAGNSTYPPSSSSALSQVVNKVATQVELTSDLNPSVYDDAVTFRATVVVGSGLPGAAGSVTFSDGGAVLGTVPLAAGVATLTTDDLDAGDHTVTAAYSGDATHDPSASPALVQHVDRAATTTTVTFATNPSPFGEIVTFTATVDPAPVAGTVQFTVDGVPLGGPVPIGPGGTAQSDPVVDLSVGDHDIEGAFSGSQNSEPSTGQVTQSVVAAQTTTELESDINPSAYGETVTFTATVSATGGASATGVLDGTVTFERDGDPIAGCEAQPVSSGVATCATSALTAGTHSITADYSGSTNFLASSASPISQEVVDASTTTTVGSEDNPSTYGDDVTFTADVAGDGGGVLPTGTVQFFVDGELFGSPVSLSAGSAWIVVPDLTAGAHEVVAEYSGDGNHEASDGAFTQTVLRANTATVVDADENPSVYGDAVTFTAVVTPTPAFGSIQFTVDGINLGLPVPIDDDGRAESDPTNEMAAGDHVVGAVFSGSQNFKPSTGTMTQSVDKAPSSTQLSVTPASPAFGQPIALTATVDGAGAGTPRGLVQFSVDGVDTGAPVTLSGGQASMTMPGPASGDHDVRAEYLGGPDHLGSADDDTLAVEASGYWMVGRGGAVYAFGDVPYLGGVSTTDAVDIEPAASGEGYWVATGTGGVAAFGDAPEFGDAIGRLFGGERVVTMSATPANDGYWLFTNIGRTLAFGAAPFLGDLSSVRLNGPVLGSVSTPTGLGYYMVASDGGVFAFGDAQFYGSMGSTPLNAPVMGLVPDSDNVGYWLVARDGGVFAFDAPFLGSMGGTPLNRPVIGMVGFGSGYLMVASDGGIFNYSDLPFRGSLGGNPPSVPIAAAGAWASS